MEKEGEGYLNRVNTVHEYAGARVVPCSRKRHHIQRRFGHVGVRMAAALFAHIELAFQRSHVHNVAVHLVVCLVL